MDCTEFCPGQRSKCGACGKPWSKHNQEPLKLVPKKELSLDGVMASLTLKNISALGSLQQMPQASTPVPASIPISDQRIVASNARASNEIMLNEVLSLIFPEGRKVSGEELTLRLHLAMGIFEKYGFGV
jgi:hypothetical protein